MQATISHNNFHLSNQNSIPLRPFLEKIIDKKIHHTALSIFEKIIDKFCHYFYKSYQQRLAFRLSENQNQENEDIENTEHTQINDNIVETAKRTLYFADGAPLYDMTATQRVKIEAVQRFNLISQQSIKGEDEIYIDNKAVQFVMPRALTGDIHEIVINFGKRYGTQEVFVTDVKECPELVLIYERETNQNLKVWHVNTAKPKTQVLSAGQLTIGSSREILIANPINLST